MGSQTINADTRIRRAFITLISNKGLTHLTVKEIIETAHVNRSTFYTHYLDKFDLLEKLEIEVLDELHELLATNPNHTMQFQKLDKTVKTYPVIQKIIDYIDQHFSLFKALLGPHGDPSFVVKAKELISTFIDANLYSRKGNHQLTSAIPQHFARELIVGQFFDILNIWLSEEQPTPPQEIAEIIQKTRYMSPYDILDLNE